MNVGRSTPKQDESIGRTESDEKSLIKTATKVQNSESLGKKESEDDLLTKPSVKTKSDPVPEDDIPNNVVTSHRPGITTNSRLTVTKPSSWEEELQREPVPTVCPKIRDCQRMHDSRYFGEKYMD